MRRIRVTLISHIHTKWLENREKRRRRKKEEQVLGKREARARNHKGSEDFGGLALA